MGPQSSSPIPSNCNIYPNITAVLNGQSLASYVTTAARSAILIPDNFKLPYSLNTTAGFGWKVNAQSSLNVDYVHTHDLDDLGETDANLPATGALTASNPRPVPQFGRVAEIIPLRPIVVRCIGNPISHQQGERVPERLGRLHLLEELDQRCDLVQHLQRHGPVPG